MVKIEKPDDEDEDGYLIHNYYYSASYNGGFQYQLGSLDNKSRYTSSNKSEYGSFGAGSYSDYNQWRRQLALVAGYGDVENVWNDESFDTTKNFINLRYLKLKKIDDPDYECNVVKPFYELISFSDCEGLIGTEVCKKLYEDFVLFDDKAKETTTQDHYFYKKYLEWKEAFRVASDNGFVSFH